jgi:benzodiazapine receptor
MWTFTANSIAVVWMSTCVLFSRVTSPAQGFQSLCSPLSRQSHALSRPQPHGNSHADCTTNHHFFKSNPTTWTRSSSKTTTCVAAVLSLVPSSSFSVTAACWSVGHLVGGTVSTPIVMKATKSSGSWYNRIALPSWKPPNFLFGPVWTVLYTCMGYAAFRVARSAGMNSIPMKLWSVHFALNMSWAPVFFGLQCFRCGLFISLGMVGTLAIILPLFYQNNPLSCYLLLPYMAWLLFATKLNQTICHLNPMVLVVKNNHHGSTATTNQGQIQAALCAAGEGYNDDMLQYDIQKLQEAAATYAGLSKYKNDLAL